MNSIPLSKRTLVRVFLAVVWLAAATSILGRVGVQKASTPKVSNKESLGESDVKQLLLLMDADKNGKISKQEWMRFMEAEFDRLDTDKSGELDVKELAHSQLRVSHPAAVGK